jgi:hypothetical protein
VTGGGFEQPVESSDNREVLEAKMSSVFEPSQSQVEQSQVEQSQSQSQSQVEQSQSQVEQFMAESSFDETGTSSHMQSHMQSESFTLAFPSAMYLYEEYASNQPVSISPRDQLSLVEDKRLWKETHKFLDKSDAVQQFVTLLQTEVLRHKPADVLGFINDHFFSLENQSKLRMTLQN